MLYKLILRLLHMTVDLLFAIFHFFNIWKYLDIVISRRLSSHFGHTGIKEKAIEKRPKHIGFLIAENDISYYDLANLVIWAMTMGITCISLYDHDGVIKKNKEAFRKQLFHSKRQLLGSENNLHFNLDSVPNLVLNKGCCNNDEDILIKVLCHLDGKWTLANTAESICRQVQEKEIKSAQIDTDLITDRLRSWHPISDPDVVVVFGSVYSSLGFIPWHIRLTELFVLPTHHKLCKQDFDSILDRFFKCEQRMGK